MTTVLVAISVAAGMAAVRWPLPGLLVYLWFDFMRPHDYLVGLGDGRPMLWIGIGLVIAAARDYRSMNVSTRLAEGVRDFLPLGLLCLAVVPGSVLSAGADWADVVSPVNLGPMKLATLSWLLAHLLRRQGDFDRAFAVIAGSLLVLAVDAIWQALDNGLYRQAALMTFVDGPGGAGGGVFRDNNDLARALVFAVSLCAAFTGGAAGRWTRLAAGLVICVLVEGVVATGSRGGLIALVCTGLYLLFASLKPWRATLATVVLSVALVGVAMPRSIVGRTKTLLRPAAESSVQSRVEIWRQGLRLAVRKPLFGHGVGTFAVPHAKGPGYPPRTAHNIFVELFFEVGGVGLVAYLFVFAHAVWRLRSSTGNAADLEPDPAVDIGPWVRARRIALQGAAIAFLVASMGLSSAFQSIPFVVVGLMLALARIRRAHPRSDR